MAKYLVQDIETIPETELQADWEAEKDKLLAEGNTRDTRFEPLWAHKVITIGMLALDEKLKPVKGGCAAGGLVGGKSEREMIERWSLVASGAAFKQRDSLRLVDWHGAKFDVPVLQTRAFRYGIQLPWLFELLPDQKGTVSGFSKEYRDRYRGKHDDLSEIWTNRGMFQKPHMENLARLMGCPGKVGIDGSKVYEAFKEGRYADIDLYCMQDVIQTALVFQRFCYMAGRLSLVDYRGAVDALLEWLDKQPEQTAFRGLMKVDEMRLESEPIATPGTFDVPSANADADHQGHDLVSAGSGGESTGPAVSSPTDLHKEAC